MPYIGEPDKLILTAKEIQRLEKGQTVFRKQLVGDDKRGVSVFRVNAPPDTVWSVIKDFSNYPIWIEDIKATHQYRKEDGDLYIRFDAESRYAGKSTWFARHNYPVDDRNWGTWTLDYDLRSDLDDSVGYWRVTTSEKHPGQSEVIYSAAIKLKSKVPGFIINLIVKSRLKQATLWVKEQAEIRNSNISDY